MKAKKKKANALPGQKLLSIGSKVTEQTKERINPPKSLISSFFLQIVALYTHTHTEQKLKTHREHNFFFFFVVKVVMDQELTGHAMPPIGGHHQATTALLYSLSSFVFFLNLFYLPWLRITAFLFLSCKKKKKKNIYAYLQTESSSLKLYERQLHLSLADRFNFENKNKLDDFPSWFRRVASSVRF